MENNDKTNMIPDEMLKDVSGGRIGGIGKLKAILKNYSTYESGDTPKYRIGQKLKIKVEDTVNSSCYGFADCTVIDVSEKANYGMIYEEFAYTIRIHRTIELKDRGIRETYEGVYESALYEI